MTGPISTEWGVFRGLEQDDPDDPQEFPFPDGYFPQPSNHWYYTDGNEKSLDGSDKY